MEVARLATSLQAQQGALAEAPRIQNQVLPSMQKELAQAVASLAQLQAQTGTNDDRVRAQEAEIEAKKAQMAEMKARLAEVEALVRDKQARARALVGRDSTGLTIPPGPTKAEPVLLPPAIAEAFEGQTLRSIRVDGISLPKEGFLAQAQVPVRVGDILTKSSIEATIAAVKKFDPDLGVTWWAAGDGMALRIFAK